MNTEQTISKTAQPADNGRDGNGLLYETKYGIKQAAKMIGIGETKMREFVKTGELPVLMIDGKCLILERDLEAFLQGHYGKMKVAKYKPERLPVLPKHIRESGLCKKVV